MTTEARNCVYSATQRILAVTAAGLVALFIFAPLQSMVKADTPAAGVSGPVVVIQTILPALPDRLLHRAPASVQIAHHSLTLAAPQPGRATIGTSSR